MNRLTKILRVMISPAFIVLSVTAFAMWFVLRLSHNFTTQITIPIELVVDYRSDTWVDAEQLTVRAVVQGNGGELLLYKFGIGQQITIPVSALDLKPIDPALPYIYRIEEESMRRALTAEQTRFNVVMITDTIARVGVSPFAQKKIPILSNITVNCARQYMQRGQIRIEPDSVTVKAPRSILDTLQAIHTQYVQLYNVRELQGGAVALIVPDNAVVQSPMVKYLIDVVGYTEQLFVLNVQSEQNDVVILPAQIKLTIRVPLNISSAAQYTPTATVDTAAGSKKSPYRPVIISGLPAEAAIERIEPQFVETYTFK